MGLAQKTRGLHESPCDQQFLAVDLDAFRAAVARGARELNHEPPTEMALEGWWEQARTLEDE
jgi:hypothetical protein